jgi:hypothetical protein
MQHFDMNNIATRFTEQAGLNLSFYERRLQGSHDICCVLEAVEFGDQVEVRDNVAFDSWEELKEKFATLHDVLEYFSRSPCWDASWRENDRILFIESIEGHEGLYEINDVVYLDLMEPKTQSTEKNNKSNSSKTKAKKK